MSAVSARELAAQGVGVRQIAEELGVTRSTVYRWLNDSYAERNRKTSREAKRRRTGRCVDCGATTHYSGGQAPSERCVRCANHANGLARRGKGKHATRIKALIRENGGTATFTQILGLFPYRGFAGQELNRLVRYGVLLRVRRGVYTLPEDAA